MFKKLSGQSARAALICVLLCSGSLLGCASTVITKVDQSDRDTTGTFDGVWNAKVVNTTTNQPLPGGWKVTCTDRTGENLGNFLVADGEASLGKDLPGAYVSSKGNFRFVVPMTEIATASTRSDSSITNGKTTYFLYGSLESGKGTTLLGVAQFGNSGCRSKVAFKKVG